MALGPENFNATIALNSVFMFQGDDYDEFLQTDSEPYLWVIMIKIDGEGLHQDGNFLVDEAKFFFSPGSHGNIGGGWSGGTRKIPAAVGRWKTSLAPIPISVAGQQLTTIPGTVLCCAVLMEEDLTPDSAVEAAHQSVNNLVKTTVADTIASLGLAGLAADAVVEVAQQANEGNPITLATAAQLTLNRRLKPIRDLFTVAAPGDVVMTILKNLNLVGALGTGLRPDTPMGVFFQSFSQAELASTFTEGWGIPNGKRVGFQPEMINMPKWAYILYGEAYAHHKFVRKAAPTNNRLQVTCTHKRYSGGEKRIFGVGGLDNDEFWALTRGEAADLIRTGKKTFYVAGPGNRIVDIFTVQGGFNFRGEPWFFLQTPADEVEGNNLLNLPDCPLDAWNSMNVEVWY
jgi:hypothetical protein